MMSWFNCQLHNGGNMIKLTLSKKIIGLALSVNLLIAGFAVYRFWDGMGHLKSDISKEVNTVLKSLEHAVAAQFYERYGDVQAFALNTVFESSDKEKVSKVLNGYIRSYGIYDLILVVDLKGRLVFSSGVNPSGDKLKLPEELWSNNFSNEDWFMAASTQSWTSDKQDNLNGTYVGQPHKNTWVEKIYGTANYNITFSSLIMRGNEPKYVIANISNFSWLMQELKASYAQMKELGFYTADFVMMSSDGKLLFDYNPSLVVNDNAQYDFTKLGKLSLVDSGNLAYLAAKADEVGYKSHTLKESNLDMYSFYSPLNSVKFTESLGWKFVLNVQESNLFSEVRTLMKGFLYPLLALSFIVAICAFMIARNVSGVFAKQVHSMMDVVYAVENAISNLRQGSAQLSSTTSEQSAAIQESVSAVSEITSMVNETSQSAQDSKKSSADVLEGTISGQEIMNKMKNAMHEIEKAGNNLSEIDDIIQNIHQKTGVINDIVFKTQLLSFNASIEAARAGQSGKGFAVVAEEVGNLAQMSGSAANEIENLLMESQKKVRLALDVTQQKLKEGNHVTGSAVSTFAGISKAIESINMKIENIATATSQQSVGLEQTQKAFKQMDESSLLNQEAANKFAAATEELKNSSSRLTEIGRNLEDQVGVSASARSTTQMKGQTNVVQLYSVKTNLNDRHVESSPSNSIDANDKSFTRYTGT